VVGLAVWRATLHWQQHGTTRSPGALLPALCLAAGMLLGTTLSLDGALSGSSGIFGVPGLALGPVGIVVLVAGVVLVLEWTALVARVWLPTVGPRLRTTVCGLGLAAAAFVFAVFLGVWFLFYDLQPLISALSTRSEASYAETSRVAWTGPYWLWAGVEHDLTALLIHENLIATALILLWLVPQSAWLRHPSRPPTGTPATPRPSRRLRAWSEYTTASLGSLAYLAATLLLRAVTPPDTPAEVPHQPDFATAPTYSFIAPPILTPAPVP